jgi:predicted ribosomally synthesized peptide with nif11-like leader
MQDKYNQLQAKIEGDQGFAEKLFSSETPDKVQSLLKEQGLEFSLDEINSFKDALVKYLEKETNAELSDEDLEDVAGGIVMTAALVGATASCLGATCGAGTFVHTVTSGRW